MARLRADRKIEEAQLNEQRVKETAELKAKEDEVAAIQSLLSTSQNEIYELEATNRSLRQELSRLKQTQNSSRNLPPCDARTASKLPGMC
jgi:septal ring factor EnvC (AmiA/AmiB activator)